jgi:recombination protein RecT
MTDQTAIERVNEYFGSETVQNRLASVLGQHNTGPYIASVLLVVANNTRLQECSAQSIYTAALRAATLRLSVDPSTGQAHIVPRKGRADFQIGYKGWYFMAMRTNRYRYINVGEVWEGEIVTENRITGIHSITGQATSKRRIGWIGAFEMTNGFTHTTYWTVEEIHEHAKRYSPAYDQPDGPWKKETKKTERKTVLADLIKRWGYLDPADRAAVEQMEAEEESTELGRDDDSPETIEGEYTATEPEAPPAKRTAEEIIGAFM